MSSRIVLTLLSFLLLQNLAFAQAATGTEAFFQGTLSFDVYGKESDQKSLKKSASFFIHVADKRFSIANQSSYQWLNNPLGLKKVSSLMVRSDLKDFVILEEEAKSAVIVQKSSLDYLIQWVESAKKSSQKSEAEANDWTIEQGVSSMKIAGLDASLTRISTVDETGKRMTFNLWLADQMKMDWGMLAESWLPAAVDEAPKDVFKVLSDYRLPLRIEYLENNDRKAYLECTQASSKPLAASMFDIPSNYETMDISTLIFKSMMGN